MIPKITLDLKGVISPLDLLKCKTALKSMNRGELLDVILADDDVAENLTTIVNRSEDEILHKKRQGDHICLRIKKGKRPFNNLNKGKDK